MSPLEAAIKAAAAHMRADFLDWKGFEEVGRVALEALLAHLPPELAEQVRRHIPD